MPEKSTLAARFASDDGARQSILDRARECAKLTKPWVLPPLEQTADTKLPENYQSIGSRGTTNMVGKMILALFPPDQPWFMLQPVAEMLFDPRLQHGEGAAFLQTVLTDLDLRSKQIQAKLESANLDNRSRRRATFRSKKRQALDQLIITGDVLEYLGDDYRLKVFRRDHYVTKRDSVGDVLYHITKECIDPLSLTPEQLSRAQFKSENSPEGKRVDERLVDLYTIVEWQPQSKKWVIRQEINGNEINVSEETITPYFSTPFDLVEGENYGRGFVEQNKGDLGSLDELGRRLLDFAELCTKMHPVADGNGAWKASDFEKPSGTLLFGDVRGGELQDLTFLKVDKVGDFQVCYQTAERIRKDMGAAMLIDSETAPQGEAGRHRLAWETVAGELAGALGGIYTPIADEQQLPILQRVYHQMERDKLFAPLPRQFIEIKALTGLAALTRQIDGAKIERVANFAGAWGPEGLRNISVGAAVNAFARAINLNAPGIVKSPEEVAAEEQAAIAAQTQLAAAQKGVEVVGNAAEHALTQGQPNA